MRVKESKELNELATLSGKPAKQVSDIIVSELLNNKIIEDIPDNWGCSVFDAISEEITEEQTAQCYTSISVALGVYVKRFSPLSRIWIWSVMAIARNVAAIWKLRTANIGAQAGTDILRLRNIAQFGRKKRAAIADIKRATNQFINKKNLSYGIEIKSK